MEVDTWEKCYPSAWQGIITPESFSHPAKFSSRLIERIYQHGIECGWLHEGSRVIDPFGGVGLGAWPALRYGMDWIGCELEPKFVTLAQANIDAWNAKYSGRLARWGTARILQGDSRHLAQIIGAAEACISSPPYAEAINAHGEGPSSIGERHKTPGANEKAVLGVGIGYGSTPGNLGNLPPGNVDAVISSPPYAESATGANSKSIDREKQYATYCASGGGQSFEAFCHTQDLHSGNYGSSPGQLASLPPGAPPFDGCVSSPPYETEQVHSRQPEWLPQKSIYYGTSTDNLGNSDTFWSAAREIVAQVYTVLAPGAHAVWVTKRYIKDKKIVEFTEQWIALCESIGFKTLHIHRAMLVKHNGTSLTLEGEKIEHKTEYISFFRRLAQKNGSPRIDWEDVTCMVKPGGEGGGWDGAISSPPYIDSINSFGNGIDLSKAINPADRRERHDHSNVALDQSYGTTPGQLGSLPPGSLDDATRHD